VAVADEPARSARSADPSWWARIPAVLHSPRTVFSTLRVDPDDAAQARQEPITALVFLGALAAVLATPTFETMLDDRRIDGVVVAVLALAAAGIYGFFGYWVLGAALYLGTRAAGAATFRSARHVLGFALAPLVLSLLVVWPAKLAFYGGDVFRTGGSDSGWGGALLDRLGLAFFAWSIGLLVLGLRTVHRWSWGRAALAAAPAMLLPGVAIVLGLVEG
jgi:hypothetical protein